VHVSGVLLHGGVEGARLPHRALHRLLGVAAQVHFESNFGKQFIIS